MTNLTAKLLAIAIAITIAFAVHTLPVNATTQWDNSSREEATENGKK